METKPDIIFETFEEYFGDIDQVKKIVDNCENCGEDYVHSHLTDYTNMCVQESSRCPCCGGKRSKKVHSIN